MKKKTIAKLIVLNLFLLFLVCLFLLRNNPNFVKFWTENIVPPYIGFISSINKVFPFSLYETLIIVIVLFCLIQLIVLFIHLFKKRGSLALHKLLNIALICSFVGFFYTAITGMQYSRRSAPLPIQETLVSSLEIKDATIYYIEKLNQIDSQIKYDQKGNMVLSISVEEISNQFNQLFKSMDSSYYFQNEVIAKEMIFSPIMSELHLTGLYFAPTGEVNINKDIKDAEKPFVIAHELSHSKGVMREDEANLHALYLCLNAPSLEIQYSGYIWTLYSLLDLYYKTSATLAEYQEVTKNIPSSYYKQLSNISDFWNSHTLLKDIGEFFNNLYLKLNGVEEGTVSYNPPPVVDDTGVVDGDNRPIYDIKEYSPYQALYLYLYLNRN